MSNNIDLQHLPRLAELFQLFNSGKHLNRVSDAALWLELEQQQTAYLALFQALGYDLRIDGRGFAWFHSEQMSATISNQSRQLALLLMVIFDTQADSGKPLHLFSDWRVDHDLLAAAFKRHQELLTAEDLTVNDLVELLGKAENFGLAWRQAGHWQLLPAVTRYLDHFEALSQHLQEQNVALHELTDSQPPAPASTDAQSLGASL